MSDSPCFVAPLTKRFVKGTEWPRGAAKRAAGESWFWARGQRNQMTLIVPQGDVSRRTAALDPQRQATRDKSVLAIYFNSIGASDIVQISALFCLPTQPTHDRPPKTVYTTTPKYKAAVYLFIICCMERSNKILRV